MEMNKTAPLVRPALLLAGILMIAANLRAPITGIAPVLEMIGTTFALETAELGILTTLPLLAFAIASPFCAPLARKYGLERSLFLALLLIAAGVLLRSAGTVSTLFIGTALIGTGIAIANVLLPSILKRDFPDRVATLTSYYALTAGVVAAIASGAAVPIATLPNSGWQWALGAFILIPFAAMALWLPQLSRHTGTALDAPGRSTSPVWRSTLAWLVTCYFGLNSLVYYSAVTWLPAILADAGYSPAAAGTLHGAVQLAGAIPGLFLGVLINRFKDQRWITAGVASLSAISLFGLFLMPQCSLLWIILYGIGGGATFILALALISLRASDACQAAALSGMAQTIGYSVAAAAPPLVGSLRDISGDWSAPLCIMVALCGLMAAIGYRAGRPAHL